MTPNLQSLIFRNLAKNPEHLLANPENKGVSYKILKAGALVVKNILWDNGLHQTQDSNQATVFWSNGSIKFNIFQQLKQGQKYNHFP